MTGTSDRTRHSKLYEAFLLELKRCISLVHNAGVIHVYLYASNIMCSQVLVDTNNVLIKIVDWDASYCLEEGKFVLKIQELLEKQRTYTRDLLDPLFGLARDLNYLSMYEVPLEDRHLSEWVVSRLGKWREGND